MANETQQAAQPAAQTQEISEFESLLTGAFKPKTDHAKDAIKAAVQTLAEQALQGVATISDDATRSIEGLIAAIDAKLSQQVNKILHNPAFQKLEGTWRGLEYMVKNTETDETLKIRILNISKQE